MTVPLFPTSLDDLEYNRVRYTWQNKSGWREEWRLEGSLHSINDHPAVIMSGALDEEHWYNHGVRHRDEILGPAWTKLNSNIQSYYHNGKLHRTAGPAMITPADKKWYRHDLLHREDGPALERINAPGTTQINYFPSLYEWWWDGIPYTNLDEWGEGSGVDPELFVLIKLKYG